MSMTIATLFQEIFALPIPGEVLNHTIQSIATDSREVQASSLFVALKGAVDHGERFIPQAIDRGAIVVVTQQSQYRVRLQQSVLMIDVVDVKDFLNNLLVRFYGNPSKSVNVLGVTGTNGKTTVTYLLEAVFGALQKRCAVIGSINYRLGEKIVESKNTTPGLVENQIYLARLETMGIPYCAMEVSSHGLQQGRVSLIDFAVGIFTNLTGDHLDYHLNMENYFQAKAILFKNLSAKSFAILNVDDVYGQRLRFMTPASVLTYGIAHPADVQAQDIVMTLKGTRFTVNTPLGSIVINSSLVGYHNVYNSLAVVATAISQQIDLAQIKSALENFSAVPGRLERVSLDSPFDVFVDYAHTHDALKNVLVSLRKVNAARIILVFGCGGNRDQLKRPLMGRVANDFADYTIVTTDNPRAEAPLKIIEQIQQGFIKENYEVVVDRKEAIARALSLAKQNDIVLIAGKGHETYQIFHNQTIHFDDREVVSDCWRSLKVEIVG